MRKIKLEDLKQLLKRRDESPTRLGLPIGCEAPVRIEEWLMATDGHCLLAFKGKEQCKAANRSLSTAKAWIDEPLGDLELPLDVLKTFANKKCCAQINGRRFNLEILSDFLSSVDRKTYRFVFNDKRCMLSIGDDDWRVILMSRKDYSDEEIPKFFMESR